MEVFRIDKAIDIKKLYLELAIGQLKKEKEHLFQSLKRRKDLAIQMNEKLYIEERVEDIYLESNSNEANKVIKELLEKNGTLQEEIKKLKREQEIQSIIFCEVMEEKNKIKRRDRWKEQ